MKYLLHFILIFLSLECFAQSDSSKTVFNHRFWINPTHIVTGEYTLIYAWRINGGNNWLEAGAGYRYIPYPFVQQLPFAPEYAGDAASPTVGLGNSGPVVRAGYSFFLHNSRQRHKSARESGTKHVESPYPIFIRLDLSYKYLHHPPDCFYRELEGEERTHTASKHCFNPQVFVSYFLTKPTEKVLAEFYLGIGLHTAVGKERIYYQSNEHDPDYHHCVTDIHDPEVYYESKPFGYWIPLPQFGIRVGFQ